MAYFKSTNGGETWNLNSSEKIQGGIWKLFIDPITTTILYTCTFGKLYKSTNFGVNWKNINNNLADVYIDELAIDPLTPTTLYIGTGKGILKSINGGLEWFDANKGIAVSNEVFVEFGGGEVQEFREELSFDRISTFAIDPTTPSTIYALGNHLYKTINSGEHWMKLLPQGIPRSAAKVEIAVDPKNPSVVYVSTERDGIFVSINGGIHWEIFQLGQNLFW